MKKAVLVRLNETVYNMLKEIAIKQKWSMNQTGEEAVLYYLKARKMFKDA